MTERPGRKALFTGAVPGVPTTSDPSKEIAAHVRQLNNDIAAVLSSAFAGNPVSPLDATKFGIEYSTLIAAVNTALTRLKPTPAAVPVPVPPGISKDEVARYEQTIAELNRRIEQMAQKPAVTPVATPESDERSRHYEKTIAGLELRYQVMVEKNPLPMLVTTPAFLITEANAACIELMGITAEDLKNTSLADFRIISQKGEGAKVALTEKRRSFGEITMELPSGRHVLEQYCTPVPGDDGSIVSLVFVYNDITTQRTKNEEIGQLRIRPETIIQQNPIPMLVTDAGFVVIEANPAYATMSGISRDLIIGTSIREIKILEQKGEGAKVAVREKKRAFGEVTVDLPSGTHILEQYVVPVLDDGNRIAGLLFVYNDVSEQRREHIELVRKMEEAAILKQQSDIIVQQNPMPIMLMDTSFKILMANEAYIKLTGLSRDRLTGMNARDFRVLSQTGEGLKKVLADKTQSYGEIKVEFPTGIHILYQYGIPMTDAQGNISTILTVYNDITSQREQETKIRTMMDEATANTELLSQSAAELQSAMAKIAAGDLTCNVSIDEADPLVKLKIDYNSSIDSIRKVLSDLLATVIRLDNTVRDTIKSTEQIAKATEQVAVSGQKSSENVKTQLNGAQKISNDMSEISASIEQIASTSHDVMTHANKAATEGEQAAEIGKLATGKMQIVEQISKQSVDEIVALNEQMHQISKIVNLITDIANQTNLLALNAAIEAARAGEHGRGFAVVAGEVKNLAGESKKASGQIEGLIRGIQAQSEQTATSMKNSFGEIKAGIESVNRTVESLNTIVSEAKIVSLGVNEITKATEDQAQATNQLMTGIESVAKLTRENQERMEEMAALAEETSASTEEIASASAELSAIAERSRKMVNAFRLN